MSSSASLAQQTGLHCASPQQCQGALAWLQVQGVGSARLIHWLAHEQDLLALWYSPRSELDGLLPPKSLANWQTLKQTVLPEALLADQKRQAAQLTAPVTLMVWSDDTYPAHLKELHAPPVLLFVQGRLSGLETTGVGIVGTRKASAYGVEVTERMIDGLSRKDIPIVSGLADGIDTIAHHAALANQHPTIAVFGCGLDTIFPAKNAKLAQTIIRSDGALVSEYPLGTPPKGSHFPARNRIIVGLSQAVAVVECPVRSGAMITARYALEENRTLLAVPGNVYHANSAGPHQLLRQGATPVWTAEQLEEELTDWGSLNGSTLESSTKQASQPVRQKTSYREDQEPLPSSMRPTVETQQSTLSEPLNSLLKRIPFDGLLIDHLQTETQQPMNQLQADLTLLELEGVIQLEPGSRVRRLH